MRQLHFLFYGEGSRDFRFLPKLVERIIEVCVGRLNKEYEILPIVQFSEKLSGSFIERMREIESKGSGFDFIIIHQDTDSRDSTEVIRTRRQPWIDECIKESIWIPLFPIQMTDSWMLADKDAICSILDLPIAEYDNEMAGRRIENIADTKTILDSLVNASEEWGIGDVYDLLPRDMEIDKLRRLKGFIDFEDSLCRSIGTLERP